MGIIFLPLTITLCRLHRASDINLSVNACRSIKEGVSRRYPIIPPLRLLVLQNLSTLCLTFSVRNVSHILYPQMRNFRNSESCTVDCFKDSSIAQIIDYREEFNNFSFGHDGRQFSMNTSTRNHLVVEIFLQHSTEYKPKGTVVDVDGPGASTDLQKIQQEFTDFRLCHFAWQAVVEVIQ